MNWVTSVKTAMELLPAIIFGLKALEQAIPGSGHGEAKLIAMREMLEKVSVQAAAMWPIIEPMITILVRLFNKTGTFQKDQ
jgi:hypothetical protein